MRTRENLSKKDSDILLIRKAKQGDYEANEELLMKYLPMIKKRSQKYFLQGAEKDDLLQEALIGYIEAVRDFDEEKNDSFLYFLSLCITRQMKEAVKKFSRKKHSPLNTYISLDTPSLNIDDEDDRKLYETLIIEEKTPEEELIHKEMIEHLEENSNFLSKFENKVFNLYMQNLSYEEIAKKLNKDYKSIDNALQRIKKKLNEKIKKYNE